MDLGFDDIENTIGYQPEMEEKCIQLSEQLDWGLGQVWLRILLNSLVQKFILHISSVFTSPQKKWKILNPQLQTCHHRSIPVIRRWSTQDAAQQKVAELQEELEKVKAEDTLTKQKLQSFQQVLGMPSWPPGIWILHNWDDL